VDPTQVGRIVIVIRVAGNGDVDSSRVAVNDGISAVVADCIAEVARHAHFEPPGEPGSTISIPFNFVRASRDGGA
jgi:acyl-coenzyme A thioesterase PaaI-like protein